MCTAEIERRSFSIISQELGPRTYAGPYDELILKRVIHASADFDYADHLSFPRRGRKRHGRPSGQGAGHCHRYPDGEGRDQQDRSGPVRRAGALLYVRSGRGPGGGGRGTTRAAVCMERAQALQQPLVFAVGNAPTALVRLYELVQEGRLTPALIIGVPVGFVNVVASKELVEQAGAPYIVARGRKGGSNVAARHL